MLSRNTQKSQKTRKQKGGRGYHCRREQDPFCIDAMFEFATGTADPVGDVYRYFVPDTATFTVVPAPRPSFVPRPTLAPTLAPTPTFTLVPSELARNNPLGIPTFKFTTPTFEFSSVILPVVMIVLTLLTIIAGHVFTRNRPERRAEIGRYVVLCLSIIVVSFLLLSTMLK